MMLKSSALKFWSSPAASAVLFVISTGCGTDSAPAGEPSSNNDDGNTRNGAEPSAGSGRPADAAPDGSGAEPASTAGGQAAPNDDDGNTFVEDDPLVLVEDEDDAAACVPAVCFPLGGQYCGEFGDGCEGKLTCSEPCPEGWACSEEGLCVGGPSCERLTECTVGDARYCGVVGDSCGGGLDCGACPEGLVCEDRLCKDPTCVPLTCESADGRYCGSIGDGCGGTLECGGCPNNAICGGGGIDNVCAGGDDCEPATCFPENGEYCGVIGDGCGGQLDCGDCSDGDVCGGEGIDNVCPGSGGPSCVGLQCQVEECAAGVSTTLTGTVYDPAGNLPLYAALVYIPNAELDPVLSGATCDTCDVTASGSPITNALTDVDGRFTLTNVPVGTNIPLVIQLGKWRRQVTIPSVDACVENQITDVNLTRLPRNQTEGNIPRMAVTTGEAEALECLLLRIGIDESEFTTDTGGGRVHLYAGGDPEETNDDAWDGVGAIAFESGEQFPIAANTLWPNADKMMQYDMMLFSCEGSSLTGAKEAHYFNPFLSWH